MAHIDIESEEKELSNINLNEQNKESDSDGVEDVLNIENEVDDDNEIDCDDNIEEEEEIQIQNRLDQWLRILQENNENLDNLDFDLDIESIDHPAENSHAKWNLSTMFKDNLHCPF
jgi:hypothetical protein